MTFAPKLISVSALRALTTLLAISLHMLRFLHWVSGKEAVCANCLLASSIVCLSRFSAKPDEHQRAMLFLCMHV